MIHNDIRLPYTYTPPSTREGIEATIAHHRRMIGVMRRSSRPGSVVRVIGIGRARIMLRMLYHALGVLDAQGNGV